MLLGKRQRPPIKRTTSMTEFILDLNNVVVAPTPTLAPMPSYDYSNNSPIKVNNDGSTRINTGGVVAGSDGFDHRILSSVSPRNFHRRNSADFVETPHFLRSCGLCKRRLAPGRDLYMYRGDTAFCSLECRQQQMNQDERNEKCSLSSKKEASSTVGSEASSNGETVAAA